MGGSSHSGSGSESDEGETFMVTGGGMKKESALAGFLAFKEKEQEASAATESSFPCHLEDLLFCSSGKEDDVSKYDRKVLAQRLVDELNLSNEHFFHGSAALSKETVKFLFEKYYSFPLLPLARLLLWQKNQDLVMETLGALIASIKEEEGLADKLWVKTIISAAESGVGGIGSKLLALSSTLVSDVFKEDMDAGASRSFTVDNTLIFCRLCREEGITTLADLVSLDLLLGKKAFKHLLNRFHAKQAASPGTQNLSFAIIADWIKASVLTKISIQTSSDKKSKKESKYKPASSSGGVGGGAGSSILPMVETSSSINTTAASYSTQASKAGNSSPKGGGVLSKLLESMRMTPPPQSSPSMGGTINKSIPIQIHPSDSNKIIVNFGGGSSAVLVDRWCPHKKADMAKGSVVGGKLICPKHKWAFDLQNGGKCLEKGACINVCPIPDW